jgi:S-methylmethionine-dependent homocysteine/selenocysteine methylase
LDRWVDYWLAETLSQIAEAQIVRELIGPADDPRVKPLWLSFTVEDEVRLSSAPRLRSGEAVADAAAAALRLDASALLFNCSQPEVMGAAVDQARQVLRAAGPVAADVRIGVYANAFPPVDAAVAEANAQLHTIRADLTPTAYGAWATDWAARGASIIGGCCGIGPEHIAALRATL